MTEGAPRLTIAANNGDIGGGEVMLLEIADTARELGWQVGVVGPETPGDLVGQARAAGHETTALHGAGRASYGWNLRRWDSSGRHGLLWCNGLVPALATAGHRSRVVHLHQEPHGIQAPARVLAVRGALATVVPSAAMGAHVPHTLVLPNWTGDIEQRPMPTAGLVVGYLGRLTRDKGVDVLAEAMTRLVGTGADVTLVLAGEARFGSAEDILVVDRALAPLGDRVHRVGWVQRESFFDRIDVAVFPSVWDEPFGLVVAEAMGSGTPFVITDAGALREVAGADHPWVARRNDPADLAQVLTRALQQDPEGRLRDVTAARTRWEHLYSPRAGRTRLAEVLATVERHAGRSAT